MNVHSLDQCFIFSQAGCAVELKFIMNKRM